MAAVSVFVDDAIRGQLPLVCAKTGEPADLVIRMRRPVGSGTGALPLLLLLLGPIGLVALFLHALLSPGQEHLTVRVPQTSGAYHSEKVLERFRLAAFAAGVATLFYAFVRPGMFPLLWFAVGAAFLAAGMALHVIIYLQAIGISLDGSRRWVTLTGVHEKFVWAVQAEEAAGRIGPRS